MKDVVATCRESIALHSKSFALASRLLPREARDEAATVYAWCRRADDAIDLAPPSAARPALGRLRAELNALYAGHPQVDPILAAFQQVVFHRAIPKKYAELLIAGLEMDVAGKRYDTLDQLLLYCFRVAGSVGLMMCHVFGCTDRRALTHAAHLGIAMQLTNICRDVEEDWQRGRLYVPREMLPAHVDPDHGGVRTVLKRMRPAFKAAVQRLLGVARTFYRSGDRGLDYLPWRAALAVRTARLVYSAIDDRLGRADYDVLAGRAVVPTWTKLLLTAWAVCLSLFSRPLRGLP